MKTIFAFFALVAVVLAAVAARPDTSETYSSQYDNFNAQELVENTRLLKNYAKCFLGEGPCTSEGTDFKKVIPEALKTHCAKCTPKQKELIRIVIRGFQEKVPDLWKKLVDKEDPKGEHKEEIEKFLNSSD